MEEPEVEPYRKEHPYSKVLNFEALALLIFIVILFLYVGSSTDANPAAVLLGFAPSLLFAVIVMLLIETDHFNPTYNLFIVVSILVIFAIIYLGVRTPTVQGIDEGQVLLLNAIIMAVALFVMQDSYSRRAPVAKLSAQKEPAKHHVIHEHHVVATPAIPLEDFVHSIEDKVKALNFVIGRVYSVYHGGTERMRNKIRIDKTLYGDFNEIPEKEIDRRKHEAIVLVEKIKQRLDSWNQSEAELFADDSKNLKNIIRDSSGKDSVLKVLIKNDKDPVQRYYDGAYKFCVDALAQLKK